MAFDVQTLENLHTVIFKIYARGGVSGSIRGTIESEIVSCSVFDRLPLPPLFLIRDTNLPRRRTALSSLKQKERTHRVNGNVLLLFTLSYNI